jgi:hypothetical protein
MQVAGLQNRPVLRGQWGYSGSNTIVESVDYSRHSSVCGHYHPHVSIPMQSIATLNEATYKELGSLVDGNFLSQKLRSDELNGIRFVGFEPEDVMNFHVNSSKSSDNRIRYTNSIQFEEWDEIGSDPDLNFAERARMLLWAGNIKLHCTCPSFLYWGYQYMCTVLDAAIYPEERYPRERNPGERGIVCKHLNRVLRVLPFHSGEIAKETKNQFG